MVVAIEQAVAGPYATRQLADAGARVIKIERVGQGDFARHYDDAVGPGCSSWFGWLNRNKESVELDLGSDHGRVVLARLLERADVLVYNLSPGAMDRMGFPVEQLRARHPRLVTCSISGYGRDGPYRDRRAYDLLVQSEAGLVTLTGTPDAPAKVGLSVADVAGGTFAYSNVLLALLRRGLTGEGAHVEVSLFDALLEWLGHQLTFTRQLGELPRRNGARHATIAPYGPFPCADHTDVVLVAQSNDEWARVCDAIGLHDERDDPRFATNHLRVVNGAALEDAISDRTKRLSSAELIDRLEDRGLAWARVNDLFDVLDHPQLRARHRWASVPGPGGVTFDALRPPVDITGVDVPMGNVPALGEHTAAVLSWLDTPTSPSADLVAPSTIAQRQPS